MLLGSCESLAFLGGIINQKKHSIKLYLIYALSPRSKTHSVMLWLKGLRYLEFRTTLGLRRRGKFSAPLVVINRANLVHPQYSIWVHMAPQRTKPRPSRAQKGAMSNAKTLETLSQTSESLDIVQTAHKISGLACSHYIGLKSSDLLISDLYE